MLTNLASWPYGIKEVFENVASGRVPTQVDLYTQCAEVFSQHWPTLSVAQRKFLRKFYTDGMQDRGCVFTSTEVKYWPHNNLSCMERELYREADCVLTEEEEAQPSRVGLGLPTAEEFAAFPRPARE